jgi:hypothetical protein
MTQRAPFGGSRRAAVLAFSVSAGLTSAFAALPAGATTPSHYGVTITNRQTQNMTLANGVYSATADNAMLKVNDLVTALQAGPIKVTTGNGSGGNEKGDLHVDVGFSWASGFGLTLDAYHSIFVDAPVVDAGTAGLTLKNNDGGTGGVLLFGPKGSISFMGTGNALSIDGAAYTLVNSVSFLASVVDGHKGDGNYALANNYDASQDGAYKLSPVAIPIRGNFNGLGNTISNLTIHSKLQRFGKGIGLFRGVYGTVASLRMANADVEVGSSTATGIVTAVVEGTIFNTSVAGKIVERPQGNGSNITMYLGGLAGLSTGTILDSQSSADLSVSAGGEQFGAYAGGLVGIISNGELQPATVESSFATGAITVAGSTIQVVAGGLIGANGSTGPLVNCYASGAVSVPASGDAGGFAGVSSGPMTTSYSTGAPSGGATPGGFVGLDKGSTLFGNIWDTTTSGITNPAQGAGNIANDPGITAMTTIELQAGLPPGFDSTIWAENRSINNGLPYLIANRPSK